MAFVRTYAWILSYAYALQGSDFREVEAAGATESYEEDTGLKTEIFAHLAPLINTATPVKTPTKSPTVEPTDSPTKAPTQTPTLFPTKAPTFFGEPTKRPTTANDYLGVLKSKLDGADDDDDQSFSSFSHSFNPRQIEPPSSVPTHVPTPAPTLKPTMSVKEYAREKAKFVKWHEACRVIGKLVL